MLLQFPSVVPAASNGAWSKECLESFAIMPVGSLADYYFSEIDMDPRSLRTQQLAEVVESRGLSYKDLNEAWAKLQMEQSA